MTRHNFENEIQLTLVDKEILNSYCKMIKGLAQYLGSSYEIVVHSLSDLEHSVIAITNGQYTGRSVGAPITDRALDMLQRFRENGTSSETYFSTNSHNELLKSTTIAIRGENNRIIGLVCMNFYMNSPFSEILRSYLPDDHSIFPSEETFASNADDMIISTVNAVKDRINADPSISASNKNKAIIYALSDKGIFKIKDSVTRVASMLGISKNTVYLHLRSYNGEDNNPSDK